jgi:glucose-1-phosphate cytidylyltransferase
MTGGHLKRVRQHVSDDEAFRMTYGDFVADNDKGAPLAAFAAYKREAAVTTVRRPGRLRLKAIGTAKSDGSWVNGGFFVLSPNVLYRVADDDTAHEQAPIEALALDGQLVAYRREGSWQPMSTLAATRKMVVAPLPNFWPGERVLQRGHTGFKGVRCALLLQQLGAHVFVLAL